MAPKAPNREKDLIHYPLREHINLKHPLVSLSELIDREKLGMEMSESFVSHRGRPATSPRLIAGLLYLQYAFALSDEEVVRHWVENP
jgi:IS5 family transposase